LPADGPMAPTLSTYTILLSALRRELNLRIKELKDEPMERIVEKVDKQRLDTRTAHIKENMHSTFDTMMVAWHSYADDAVRRIDSPNAGDTSPLDIDAYIVNLVLKSCHAVYSSNRALGRMGLKIAEQVYGMDKAFDLGNTNDTMSAVASQSLPLASRIRSPDRRNDAKAMSKQKIFNIDTLDLVLELCKRDMQPTKAIRFWRSLEKHFAGDLEPIKTNFTDRIEQFRAQMSRKSN
ncbi:hypothetical protein GGI23_006897, partial [Coemansia sp. RSA 2559]